MAARVSDTQRLAAAIANAKRQTNFPRSAGWNPCAIAQGNAGPGGDVYISGRLRANEQWDVTAHGFLNVAVRDAERVQINPVGPFSGLSGLAFVASELSRGGARYQRLLVGLDSVLVPAATALAERAKSTTDGLAVADYDVISGLSGVEVLPPFPT